MAISKRFLNADERVIVSTRTHAKALIVPVLIAILVIGAAVAVASFVSGEQATLWYAVIALVTLALLAVFVGVPVANWATTSYTFTDQRFLKRSGIVARKGRSIPLNRISSVDFEVGVIDRLFGCGTLIVADASTNGRAVLHDIPRVERVQLLVAEELARLNGRRNDGA